MQLMIGIQETYPKGACEMFIDAEKVKKELRELRHYRDTSEGLWCIDRDPSEVTHEWIRENAFQLKDKE